MIRYQRNNIGFRIASANAISKFKNTQAHSFIQLVRKELSFDESSRETVLLEYDRLSQWIFRVERICFTAGAGYMTEQLQIAIIQSLIDEFDVIESVMESNSQIFSAESIAYAKMIHQYAIVIMSNYFDEFMKLKMDSAYTDIVACVSNYLQHLLVCMHEFNSNLVLKNTDKFICVSDFSIESADGDERFLSGISRARFFKQHGMGDSYTLKNYSRHNVFADANEFFSSQGFLLRPEDEIQPVSK